MAEQDAIWVLGCMSGTSMDGVDAALILTDGEEVFEFGATGFRQAFDLALTDILADIRDDLEEFGVRYDSWFSERSCVNCLHRHNGL